MSSQACLYGVLGVEVSATPTEIRKAYRTLARRYHPDKNVLAGNPQSEDVAQVQDMFSLVARAYEVLIDPTKRVAYDMLNGHVDSGDTHYAELGQMKKKDAEQAVELMRLTFDIKRRTELSRGGLVIDDAVYGARDIIETNRLEDLATSKWVQNVTRQLQCAVEKSKLVIPGNEPKHYLIPGLYDAAPGEEKLLWVRYYFRGKIHQVVVQDEQRLLMPLKSHCIQKFAKKQSKIKKLIQQTQNEESADTATTSKKRSSKLTGGLIALLIALSTSGVAYGVAHLVMNKNDTEFMQNIMQGFIKSPGSSFHNFMQAISRRAKFIS